MTDIEQSNDNKVADADDSIDSSLAGIRLKAQREELKMTAQEVASNLNLDVSYIVAIEANDYSEISSTSYVYGYIRSYAKLLKLPEQEILDLYMHDKTETAQLLPDYMGQKKIFTETQSKKSVLSMSFIIVISLLAITWWFIRG